MGKMKQILFDIEDMLLNGYDADDVSLILDVDIKIVKDVIKDLDKNPTETHNEY